MEGDPGADSWTTVDRKTAKKKTKEPSNDSEGWSQVTKDRKGKDGGRPDRNNERRGDRRGGDRGKPPSRGGSTHRNTLPRKQQGGREGGSGWQPHRNSPSPAPSFRPPSTNRPVAGNHDEKELPKPENVPRKSSWASKVSNPNPEGPKASDSSQPLVQPPTLQKVEIVENPGVKEAGKNEDVESDSPAVADKVDLGEVTADVETTVKAESSTDDQNVSSTGISVDHTDNVEVPNVENIVIVPKPTETDNKTELDTDSEQAAVNNLDSSQSSAHNSQVPVEARTKSVVEREGLSFNIDNDSADPPVDKSKSGEDGKTDNNGNTLLQLDDNKNETQSSSSGKRDMSLEELLSSISPETRHYGRDILLQLQRHPLSLQKPEKLPELEIVLDVPLRSTNSAPVLGDLPSQYVSNSYSRGNYPSRRDSRRKESAVKKVISISREPVNLHKTENAWVPGTMSSKDKTEIDLLTNSVRSILNKLTPQKFETLVVQFKDLRIDTEEKLVLCMELVFEKAVSEPAFSTAYAAMCNELFQKKVLKDNSTELVDFRMLLLRRCQKEFEKEYMSEAEKNKFAEELKAAATEDDKKRIKAEFELVESKLRQRSLGNVRFIGELYKLDLMMPKIMHSILKKLLSAVDDESLEGLCQLLSTCGSRLEEQTVKQTANISKELRENYSFDKYFQQIQKIIDEKKTSSRVRFLLQDVIELRQNKWVKRRQDAGPKTIQQIHKEAQLEALQIQLADQKPLPPVGRRSEEQNRRKTEFRPKPLAEDMWGIVPKRAAKISDVVDPERLRLKKVDADNLKLGPSFGRGFASAGGFGTQGKQTEIVKNTNIFELLDDSDPTESNPPIYHGRASEPVLSSYDRGTGAGFLKEKEALRSFSRQQSSSIPRSRLLGDSSMDSEKLRTRFSTLLEEFIENCDFKETLSSICELFHPDTLAILVEETFNLGLEKKLVQQRTKCGILLVNLMQEEILSADVLCSGLGVILEIASDMIIDIPKLWDLLADILTPVLVTVGHVEIILENSCSYIETETLRQNFLNSLLKNIANAHSEAFAQLTKESKPVLEKLLAQSLESYLAQHNLSPPKAAEVLVNGSLQEDLFKKLESVLRKQQTGNEELSAVDQILSDKIMDRETVKTIVTAVIESSIDGMGGPSVNCTLNNMTLRGRIPILKKCIDANKDRELYALFAIQRLVTRLEHPNKLLHTIIEELYEAECISEDGLYDWEKDEDPEEQEGKGVALKSCNQLFKWLKEAEEEDDQVS